MNILPFDFEKFRTREYLSVHEDNSLGVYLKHEGSLIVIRRAGKFACTRDRVDMTDPKGLVSLEDLIPSLPVFSLEELKERKYYLLTAERKILFLDYIEEDATTGFPIRCETVSGSRVYYTVQGRFESHTTDTRDLAYLIPYYLQEANMPNTLNTLIENNTNALKNSAEIELGATATRIITKHLSPVLPESASGVLETPLGKAAVANLVAAALLQFLPHNENAEVVARALSSAGMHGIISSLNIEQLVTELLSVACLNNTAE